MQITYTNAAPVPLSSIEPGQLFRSVDALCLRIIDVPNNECSQNTARAVIVQQLSTDPTNAGAGALTGWPLDDLVIPVTSITIE